MDDLGVGQDKTLMIGDTTHDMAMAQNASVARLGAAYGAHPKAELLPYARSRVSTGSRSCANG